MIGRTVLKLLGWAMFCGVSGGVGAAAGVALVLAAWDAGIR